MAYIEQEVLDTFLLKEMKLSKEAISSIPNYRKSFIINYWIHTGKTEDSIKEIMDRQTGRTTRCVDSAIQTLFNVGQVYIFDHLEGTKYNTMVYEKVMRRLQLEHPHIIDQLEHNKSKCHIKIKTR